MSLNPIDLAVESFATASAEPALGVTTEPVPTTMRTHERDCTYPDLCGGTN
ncbi:MAG TPA: hypothetical protein VF092_24285 [Longimicrobium sp.]